ncbi:type IV secretion protein Rhs [Streptomyces lavendulae]|nr:RHS repeat-associated core domain-containing protein [Streptomyces lavendulae]TXJ85449.1 type IV secretion protein Rhs [Streptomyces lavendulae]
MAGWGKLGGEILSGGKSLYDHAKRDTGQLIDDGADLTGDALDKVGAHGVAQKVRHAGDRAASYLGAHVAERELGPDVEPSDLIHGKPSTIREKAKHLVVFATAFEEVGVGMKAVDSGGWQGRAADTFREKFALHPAKWLQAAVAFQDAATALDGLADTVEWAQGQAREAIRLYKRGKSASDAYRKQVHSYNLKVEAGSDDPGPRPSDKDPGAGTLQEAQQVLDAARTQRNRIAGETGTKLKAALQHAPKEPSVGRQLKLDGTDLLAANAIDGAHFFGGIVKGTAGIVNFFRSVDPLDAYNLTHPAAFLQNKVQLLGGVVSMATHPDRALDSAWKSFSSDPGNFMGELVPQVVLAVGTDGAGTVADEGMLAADGAEAAETGATELPGAAEGQTPADVESAGTDPVNLATGRMFLDQTDVSLPGALPFVVKRRVESGTAYGRRLGPSWAGTLDQRLGIAAAGVTFLHEDGMRLFYPHPAPGLPVLPAHGPRWPLSRETDGYTVTDPRSGRTWHFEDQDENLAALVRIEDRNGNRAVFEYDAAGVPTAVAHSGGYRLRIDSADGLVTGVHLVGGAADGADLPLVRYGYTRGNLTEVRNSSGLPLRFDYDEAGRVTSWTDTNGHAYAYAYDSADRCVTQGGAEGQMGLRLSYGERDPESGLRTTTAVNGAGAVRRYFVNDLYQIVAVVDPAGHTRRFTHDRFNRLLSETDAVGRTTSYRYDDLGNPTETVRPDGRRTVFSYDSLGRLTRVAHPDGRTVRQEFDDRGNRTSVTDADGARTSFTYDGSGRLTAVRDQYGRVTEIRCDAAGLPVEMRDHAGGVMRYERDALGRVVSLTDPSGATGEMAWSVEGSITRRRNPDGSEESWTYDGEGNCLTHTDTLGQVTRFEYAAFDLLTARTEPDGSRHEFEYDTELRLTRVTNPLGLTWEYEYDKVGRPVAETDFGGRVVRYSYNAAGDLVSRTNALGQTVTFEHDELGQVVRKGVDGEVMAYTYDFTGQIARAESSDAILTLLRDRHGRLVSERIDGREVAYRYDRFGNLTRRTTPSGAESVWEYDGAGKPARLTADGRVIALEYDQVGRETGRRFGETLSISRSFDAMNRLISQTVEHERGRVQSRSYEYRPDGSLSRVDDQLDGVRSYELDRAGRTTGVSGDGWAESYAYDTLGNQVAADWPARRFGDEGCGDRVYRGTDLVRAGRIRYEYDDAGRVVLRQKTRLSRRPDTWRYSWDAEDRLTRVVTPDGTIWRYRYDALGRRVGKQRMAEDGVGVLEQVDFSWDGVTLCEQTTSWPDSADSVTLTWHLHGAEAVAQSERRAIADAPQEEVDARFFAMVSDLSGSPCELVDEFGEIAWRSRSTNWGKLSWPAESRAYTPLRFPGQYFDHETGLNYNYLRYYDPDVGRYMSLDPLGLAPAANPVGYVDRPAVTCDPLGLAPQKSAVPPKPYETLNFPDMAKQFNPGGGNTNCTFVADAFERYMRGEGINPVPADMGGLQSLERLEGVYGSSFKDTDFWGMVDHLRNSGDGARGIVAARPGEGMPGHVFNVVNQQGRVLFVDAQTGFVNPMYFKTFKLMRTH